MRGKFPRIMHLVTVTCNRDFNQMLLQAESISKFVEPCTHYVIVNEPSANLQFWYNWLSPYYSNHKLFLLQRIEYNYQELGIDTRNNGTYVGWVLQQLQKLLIAYHINEDYLVLDSKNFFINECNINEWENVLGNYLLMNPPAAGDPYRHSYEYYCETLGTSRDPVYSMATPFKIERKYITDCKYFDFYGLGKKLINVLNFPPSEFLFYSFLVPGNHISFGSDRPMLLKTIELWEGNYDTDMLAFIDFCDKISDKDYKLASIHRQFLSNASPAFFKLINSKLKAMGFENMVRPMASDALM